MIIATVLITASAAGAGAWKAATVLLNPADAASRSASVARSAPSKATLPARPAAPAQAQTPVPAAEAPPEKTVAAAEPSRPAAEPSVKNTILENLSKLEDHFRLDHARELMGKYYDQSVVRRAGEKVDEIDLFGLETVQRKLSDKWKPAAGEIYSAIKTEARRFGFDPLFLIAVIDGESSFKPEIRGPVGEIGMMQLRGSTAEWIAEKYHMPYSGEKSLEDPITNIQLGSAYLAYLRDQHDSHSRLYLSAYNMGSRNVKKALDKSVWPKDYAKHVMRRYVKLYTRLKQSILDRSSASETELPKAEVKAERPKANRKSASAKSSARGKRSKS